MVIPPSETLAAHDAGAQESAAAFDTASDTGWVARAIDFDAKAAAEALADAPDEDLAGPDLPIADDTADLGLQADATEATDGGWEIIDDGNAEADAPVGPDVLADTVQPEIIDAPVDDSDPADASDNDPGNSDPDATAPLDLADSQEIAIDLVEIALSDSVPDVAPEVIDPNKCPYGLSPKTLCLKWGVCSQGVVLGCVGNSPVCDYSGVAGYEEVEKSCDGLDNDCNQLVDDELPLPKLPGTKGVCAGQKPICAGKNGWTVPDYAGLPAYQTQETACDGLDNDCDGKTDLFFAAPPLSAKPGVCGLALQLCSGKQGWVDPPLGLVAGYQPLESACDGKDNDCDGLTDEDLGKPNPPGSGIGKADLGVCAGAPLQCKAGKWVAPDYVAWSALAPSGTPTFEELEMTCDGLDNDCNGSVDDLVQPAPEASKSKGVCIAQVKLCKAAKGWQDPDFAQIAGYGAGPEVTCDGQDNDCDGMTDEDAACPRWQSGGKGNGRLALSPDGAQLAWLSATGVHVHNTLTGAHAYDHFGHRFGVEAVAFSPDGTRIASVGKIDALRIYYAAYGLGKPASWPVVLALGKATDHFTAVAWSADAKTVAVGTDKGAVFAIDVGTGAAVANWSPHSKPVRAVVAYAKPGGGLGLVSAGDDGKVQLLDGAGLATTTLAVLGSPVRQLHYDAASHRIAAASDQLAPRVIDLATGKQVAVLGGVPDVADVQLAPSATSAVASTIAGQLFQWPLPIGIAAVPPVVQPKAVADVPVTTVADTAVDLAIGPTAAYVGFVARGPARLALPGGAWSWPIARHTGPVFDLAVQQDVLWSAGQQGAVGVWSAATGTPGGMHVLHDGDVLTLAVAQPVGLGALLISAATDYSVRVWQVGADPALAGPVNLKTFGLGGPWVRDLALVAGAASVWAAAGSGAHRLGLTQATLGQKLQVYAVGLGASVRSVAASPNGQSLAVALDGTGPAGGDHLRMVDAATLQAAWQRKDLAADDSAVAFRPQGDLLAVGGGPMALQLLDVKTGETVAVLVGHTAAVRSLDWTADGTRLLSTANDGTARVWSVVPGKAALSLVAMARHCPGICTGVAVTAGIWGDTAGSYVITAADDGAILAWDAPGAP